MGGKGLEAHPTHEAALEHGLGQLPPSPGRQPPSRLFGPGVGSPGYMGKPRAEGDKPDLEEEEGGGSEPKLPIRYGAAALSRALRKRGSQVLEAEQELEGAKRRHQEATKCMEESEEKLAVVREEQRKCTELYQKAAQEAPGGALGGPSFGVLAAFLNVAPKAALFLEADEAQRAQELLGSLKELLEGGARRAARWDEQKAAAASGRAKEGGPAGAGDGADAAGPKEDEAGSAAAGASAKVKKPRREGGEEQPDMDDFDAELAVARGMGPELLAKLPPGAKEVMAHLIELYRSAGPGQPAGP